jgi:hypothetical protein
VPVGGERGEGEMSEERLYIANAFSLGMLETSPTKEVLLRIKEIDVETVKAMLTQPFISAVGHESTAKLLTALLGVEVPYNRIQVRLQKGDRLLVFQLLTRLEEGKVLDEDELRRLPHKFYIVEVVG